MVALLVLVALGLAPAASEVRNTAAMPEPRSPVATTLLVSGGLVALLALGLAIRPLRRRLGG